MENIVKKRINMIELFELFAILLVIVKKENSFLRMNIEQMRTEIALVYVITVIKLVKFI